MRAAALVAAVSLSACAPDVSGIFSTTFLCPLGTAQLQGTGFDQDQPRGATGWLTTTVPVTPGSEVTIRWGVYDAGDGALDATVVLDNWQWITTPGVTYGTKIAE